jgi:Sulfotransferase family
MTGEMAGMGPANPTIPLAERTFVCGVGVQKAGTTWLHNYLASRGDVYMPARKELHYFDNRFRNDLAPGIERHLVNTVRKQLAALGAKPPFTYPEQLVEALDRLRMQYDARAYPDYFASRIGSQSHFGEVTPAYCLIGSEGFAAMKACFGRIRIVYLMRDPVDRHASMVRMMVRDKKTAEPLATKFLATLEWRFAAEMADYRTHIETLRAAFKPEELFFGFYETLFSDAEVRRLCDFLSLPFKPGNYTHRPNASPETGSLPETHLRQARAAFEKTYTYCRAEFPELRERWRHNP